MTTTTAFDLATFARAIEERDASTQLAMYAEDAEVTLADRVNQPSAPRVLGSKEEIRVWLEDACARDMVHEVGLTVADGNGAAFTEDCRYPDGKRVLCVSVLELADGLIVRQIGAQAWDD